MTSAIQKYTNENGRVVVYGYEDEVSAVEHTVLDEWREGKRRREMVERGPILNYVNCYHEPAATLIDALDVNELGAIMKLIPYIKINTDGALHYGGKRMTVALMAKAIGKSPRQTTTIATKLLKVGVLHREKVGRAYVFNVDERYHTIGYVRKDAQYTKVLQVKTRVDIRNISIQAAGVLYKMLPFFNYEHFYLCTNPNEPDEDAIYPISHREFADLVGVDRNVIDRGIRELVRHGFIMKIIASNGELYIVNPDIATRRRNNFDENAERVRGMFRLAERQGDGSASVKKSELPY